MAYEIDIRKINIDATKCRFSDVTREVTASEGDFKTVAKAEHDKKVMKRGRIRC